MLPLEAMGVMVILLACMNCLRWLAGLKLKWYRLDGLVPNTPMSRMTNGASKRKSAFETPKPSKVSKPVAKSSPTDGRATPMQANGLIDGVP